MIYNIANTMTDSMVKRKILVLEKRDYYSYILEVFIEKAITYSLLIIISLFMHQTISTLFFMVFFFSLRERTGGFHFDSFSKCLMSTFVIYFFMNTALLTFFLSHQIIMYVILSISAVIIMYIGNVNHPNIDLDADEVRDCKKSARTIVLVEMLCIISEIVLSFNIMCIIFESQAIIMCAFLLCIAKITKQEVI